MTKLTLRLDYKDQITHIFGENKIAKKPRSNFYKETTRKRGGMREKITEERDFVFEIEIKKRYRKSDWLRKRERDKERERDRESERVSEREREREIECERLGWERGGVILRKTKTARKMLERKREGSKRGKMSQ